MPCDVRVERVEARSTAVVHRQAKGHTLSDVIPKACGEVWQFLRSTGTPHLGLNLVVYLDGDFNLECGVLVAGPFTSTGAVVSSTTPSGLVATAVHTGPYDQLGETHEAVLAWCLDQGQRRAGPSWEIYGHWNDDPAQLRTEVFWLLEEATGPAT